MPKNVLFLSTFKKGKKMAKWPNYFIFGKQFQKRPNMADLAFKKAKWQPRSEVSFNADMNCY